MGKRKKLPGFLPEMDVSLTEHNKNVFGIV